MRFSRRKRKPLLSKRAVLTSSTRLLRSPNSVSALTSAPASGSGRRSCLTVFPWHGERRAKCCPSIDSHGKTIRIRGSIVVEGRAIELTPLEAQVLGELIDRSPAVVRREDLIRAHL